MVLWLIIILTLAVISFMIAELVAGPFLLNKTRTTQPRSKPNYAFELGEELSTMRKPEKQSTKNTKKELTREEQYSPAASLPDTATRFEITEELTPQPATPPAWVHELPNTYGEDKIVALVRDPYWIFVYWEITQRKRAEIERDYGPSAWNDSPPILRVYDTTDVIFTESGPHTFYDIYINNYASSWHINVGRPNRTFCVERGLILPDGRYVPLLRSNFVTTPLDHVSEIIDEEWLLITENDRKLYQRIGDLAFGVSSPAKAYGIEFNQELAFGISSPQMNQPADPNQWRSNSMKTGKE